MGSSGSGRWTYHEKRRTVEECWAMSNSEVDRVVDFSKPGSISHLLRPMIPKTGKRMSPVRTKSKVGDDGKPLLGLSYTVKDRQGLEHRVEELVRLQTTRPNFGGVRWWFSCPRVVDGEECDRRVGKLYRPPGRRTFACRHCLDLTYESCQKSHRYDGLFALMAGEASGESFEVLKRAFSYRAKEARRRRAEPSPTLLEAFEEVFGGAEGHEDTGAALRERLLSGGKPYIARTWLGSLGEHDPRKRKIVPDESGCPARRGQP